MGFFDKVTRKAKDSLAKHPDKVGQGIDKLADTIDKRTGGKYAEQIDRGADEVKDRAADYGRRQDDPPTPR
jgi:hypothetical protein